ncbi:DNA-binding SARP family transcriptional activator [Actinoallomurus bryophytorum]|uniref:DNA-binding SARP family transcriptional activator n=1 Tax=Actinoallomurus bryophytorum TaxID=1490222 RepID=A0A543C030_9ACTN|nr:DNA-binding SARP family transcriptional activator [Actinoallomurus bryophytorum]
MVEFGLLGDIRARVDGRSLDLGHARQRCVLAVLLVEANRVVPVDQLVERVWGERSPQRAQETLYSYLSRIRQALSIAGDEVEIARRSGGYALAVDKNAVDLHRFRRMIAQTRTAWDDDHAAPLFEQALELWQGEPFAGVDTPWFNSVREALLWEKLAAELALGDLQLRLGRHSELMAELSIRIQAHPLDERLAGQLMLALYRSGRAGEALAQYRHIRKRLAEEVGADPGPPLQHLHQQILTADPALTVPIRSRARTAPAFAPAPRQLPAPPPLFVGRNRELAHLDRLLGPRAERGDTMTISTIGGAGGSGKTWLALHWAHTQQQHFPDGQLYADLRGFSASAEPIPPTVAVRTFLDALDVAPAEIPADPDAQAALYRSLTAGKRLLIILDNARDSTQVLPLLPGSPRCIVLVTSRHQLTGLITGHGGIPLTLDVLTESESQELLSLRLGPDRIAAQPDAAATLLRHCAGLPLAISILAARATMNRALSLTALATELREATTRLDVLDAGETTADLRAVFATSYRALDAQTAKVFRQLALAPGPDVGLPAAASLTALPLPRLRTHVRKLQAAHLIQEHTPGRHTCHDLLRTYATELAHTLDSDAERHTALGRILDHYLHTARTAERLIQPHRDPITLAPAADGVSPERLTTHDQAMEWLTRESAPLLTAVEHAARTGLDTHAWQLAWTATTYLCRRGRWHDVEALQRTALAAATRLGDRSAQTECHRPLAYALIETHRFPEARHELVRALELSTDLGDSRGQAHTHLALGWMYERQGDQQTALHHDLKALDLFTSLGHRSGRARALNAVGWDHTKLGLYQQAIAHCREALTLQQELEDERGQASTWDSLGYAYQQISDYRYAIDCYRRSLELNRALGHRFNEAETLVHLGEARRATGDDHAAQDAWRKAINILVDIGHDAELDRIHALLNDLGQTPT